MHTICACDAAGPETNEPPAKEDGAGDRPVWIDECMAVPGCTTPHVVSHRGEGTGAPENSLSAINEAFALGADIVEIDVRVTKDDIPVLMHDTTLMRTTNQEDVDAARPEVKDWTYDELKELALFDPSGLCEEASTREVTRCQIPTLAEAVETARGQGLLMLDYKAERSDIALIAAVLVESNAENSLFFFDSDLDVNLEMAALVPGLVVMPRAYHTEDIGSILEETSPLMIHIEPHFMQEASDYLSGEPIKLFADVFFDFDYFIVAAEVSGDGDHINEANETIAELMDAGAHILQTNRPVELREAMNLWLSKQD